MDFSRYAKARMVARGFQDFEEAIKEVPTCHRESILILLTIAVSHGWDIYNEDIKTAYLQGENYTRNMYVRPPKEVKLPKGKIWK
eukprot:4254133-Prymnesium_polylepis.1